MSIHALQNKYKEKALKIPEVIEEIYGRIDTQGLNAYITLNKEAAMEQARLQQEKLDKGETLGAFFGVPFAIKDNISTKGLRTTCASKMLENFEPIYDATIIRRILAEDGIIIGKANMDEFAMGSSSETSYFGVTYNPLDKTLIPGGSSSGSAAAVAGGEALIGIGSDTGGSARQPAAYCNIYGYLPSYGTISRYGVASMANSFDQVAILADTVEDLVATVNLIGGKDEKDATSLSKDTLNFRLEEKFSLKDMRIAVPMNIESYGVEDSVLEDFRSGIKDLEALGAVIEEVNFQYLKYSSNTYHVLMSSEVSSNMSRFDGIRYGYLTEDYDTTADLYIKTRSEGFGEEVQRRIALGTLYMSAENGQEIYKQGLKLRTLIRKEMKEVLSGRDFILTPTTTNLPYPIGSQEEDPLAVYSSGDFCVPVNIAALCAVSLPVRKGLSGSIQLIGDSFRDEKLLNACYAFERRDSHDL